MKNSASLLLISFFFLFSHFSHAQSKVLTGAIVIGNAEVMSYKIHYDLKGNNTLSGYSVSDENGKEETTASISGYFNPKKKVLFFEEKKILSTRSMTPINEFCLMKVTGTLEKRGQNAVFVGNFEASSPDKSIICEKGSIMLMSEKTVNNLAAKLPKEDKHRPKSDSSEMHSAKVRPVEWIKNEFELVSGDTQIMKLKGDEIQIDLVDDRYQDGDRITLMMNEATIVKNMEVTNQVKSYNLKLPNDSKDVSFRIIAESEGSIALTTVKAVLRNGNEVNVINISLNKGQSVTIKFKE